jgi:hypothetical protein
MPRAVLDGIFKIQALYISNRFAIIGSAENHNRLSEQMPPFWTKIMFFRNLGPDTLFLTARLAKIKSVE